MSITPISRAANSCSGAGPNSRAALDGVTECPCWHWPCRAPWRAEAWACTTKAEKSVVAEGVAHRADHPPAGGADEIAGVAFQRMAEGVVGVKKEPGVRRRCAHDRRAGALGQHPGVVGPVHRVRAALARRLSPRSPRRIAEDLVLLPCDLVYRKRHRGGRPRRGRRPRPGRTIAARCWRRHQACSDGRRRAPRH